MAKRAGMLEYWHSLGQRSSLKVKAGQSSHSQEENVDMSSSESALLIIMTTYH